LHSAVVVRSYADFTVKLGKLAESLTEADIGTIMVAVGDQGKNATQRQE
jgi:hypothetical protein